MLTCITIDKQLLVNGINSDSFQTLLEFIVRLKRGGGELFFKKEGGLRLHMTIPIYMVYIGTCKCKSHSPPFWRNKKPTHPLLARTKNFRCFWKLSEFIPLTNDYLCIVIHVHMISESPVDFCFVFMEKYRYLWCPNSHIFRRWAYKHIHPKKTYFTYF